MHTYYDKYCTCVHDNDNEYIFRHMIQYNNIQGYPSEL